MRSAPLACAAALVTAGLILVAAGQPLFAEDSWWHLSLGAAYAEQGPRLASDPLLHTAEGPPAPAAWLFDVTLHAVAQVAGFQALRVLHVLLVLAIVALAAALLWRASGSLELTGLGVVLFCALSAYRLFQLRPHLATMLATLVLFRLLLESRDTPSWRRVAATTLLFALWANLHAGFVLGLVLLGGAAGARALLAIRDPRERPAAARLAAALGLALLATLANPSGAGPHLLYFQAGSETPSLEVVADEWAPLPLLRLPRAGVPPDALAWAAAWALLIATPLAAWRRLRAQPRELPLVALAALSLVAMVAALRLSWLAIVPLLLLARTAGVPGGSDARRGSVRLRWGAAAGALALVPAFVLGGAWPSISRGVHRVTFSQPFATSKLDTHAVWFLRDAELEGNLFNDYAGGNFLGYWLAPRLKVFVNGSLNVPPEVMEAERAIRARTGLDGVDFLGLLDRYRIDVFFGSGLPVVAGPRRETSTTTHLEGAPGWRLVFRSARSAVYLRDDPRNRENLERVAAYYRRERVPFDPGHGFDTERVIRGAPRWAVEHGLLPFAFDNWQLQARLIGGPERARAEDGIAEIYALLGLYERAAAIDRRRLGTDPGALAAARRLVWSLLHLGSTREALEAAERLEALAPPSDALSGALVAAARRQPELSPEERAAAVARLPLLWPQEAQRALLGVLGADPRPPRRS